VLNINDHSITGDGIGAAITDAGMTLTNIQIRQGTITGFETAIDLAASTGCVVEYINAFGNLADGINLGAQGIARHNVVLNNYRGLVMTCPANAIGNSAWDNAEDDLYLINPESCSLSEGLNSFGSTGGSYPTCESVGLIDCGGSCINPLTDEEYCGASGDCLGGNSGVHCASGELCNAGICQLTCQAGQINCDGSCVNPLTDEEYCGASGDCQGLNAGVDCTATGKLCVAGSCLASNEAPVANNDNASVDEGGVVNINLAANDVDADGTLDLSSIVIISPPANGWVVVNGDGTVDYTHDGSETISDTFAYRISDDSGAASNTATVTLTIIPI
jgi:hypothetical protein